MSAISRWKTWVLVLASTVTLAVAFPAQAQDDEKIQELTEKMHRLYEQGKYEQALDAGKELLKLEPDNGETLYNVGCLYSRTGKADQAIEHLEKAAKAGFRDVEQYENDPDLAPLRSDSRFKKLMNELRGVATAGTRESAGPPQGPGGGSPPSAREQEVRALTQRMLREAQKGNDRKALELAEEALELAPDMWLTNYNVACMHARLNHKKEALRYLDLAVDKGLSDPQQVESDPDFNNIRREPGYREIMARIGGSVPTPPEPEPVPRRVQPPPPPPPPVARRVDPPPSAGPSGPWHVTLPEDYDSTRSAPLLIVLHEQGANMRIATEEWERAASDAGVILLTPQGNVPVGPDRYEWDRSAERTVAELTAAVDQVMRDYRINDREIVIAGTEQGATLACLLALRYPERFCGVIAVSPHVTTAEHGRFAGKDLSGVRFYFIVDEDAPDLKAQKKFYKAVKEEGAKAKFEDFDDLRDMSRKKRVREQGKAIKYVLEERRKEAAKERKQRQKRDEDDD